MQYPLIISLLVNSPCYSTWVESLVHGRNTAAIPNLNIISRVYCPIAHASEVCKVFNSYLVSKYPYWWYYGSFKINISNMREISWTRLLFHFEVFRFKYRNLSLPLRHCLTFADFSPWLQTLYSVVYITEWITKQLQSCLTNETYKLRRLQFFVLLTQYCL